MYLLNNEVVYAKNWNSSDSLAGKKDQLISSKPDGTSKHVIKEFSYSADSSFFLDLTVYKPNKLYVAQLGGDSPKFYTYGNGTLTPASIKERDYYKRYTTYLVSPNGQQTFWSESRDGKNALFVGDADANNAKQIASLSDYTPYGWFTPSYLLVAKDNSQLYVMPASGGKPVKVTDYHKADYDFSGYGYGYGGL